TFLSLILCQQSRSTIFPYTTLFRSIKNKDISIKEYAKIAEHLNSLPGIDATTDWERKYVHDDTFKSILGSITSQEEGIPADKEDYFLARGYNRNDRIGKSGLEEQ